MIRLKFLFSLSVFFLVTSHFVASKDFAIPQPNYLDSLKSILDNSTEKDSTYIITLLQFANKFRVSNTDTALILFKESAELSKELNNDLLEGRSYSFIGICYGMLNQFAEAITATNSAIEIFKKTNHLTYQGSSYNNLAIIYKRLGDLEKSLEFQLLARETYDSAGYELGSAKVSNNLGSLFKKMDDFERAEEYYKRARYLYNKLSKKGDSTGIASSRLNLGLLYASTGKLELAKAILDSANRYYDRNNILTEKVLVYNGLADIYNQEKNYDLLFTTLKNAVALSKETKAVDSEIYQQSLYATAYHEQGRYNKSLAHAREVLYLSDTKGGLQQLKDANKLLADIFEDNEKPDSALFYHKRYKVLEDSIYNEETASLFKSFELKEEVNKKDNELALRAKEISLLEEKVKLENRWKWALGMASLLLFLAIILYYQKLKQQKNFSKALNDKNKLISSQNVEIAQKNHLLKEQIKLRTETDDTINYFASSLYGKNTLKEILWDITKNCIARLGLVDCVIYILDEERNVLIQSAAYGFKNPEEFEIHNPIEIPLGKGIVGSVAQSGEAEIVNDTVLDKRYIVDDLSRFSELTVPLIYQKKVIGVIDSEHPEKNFFTQYHLDSLKTIAAICASKIAEVKADEVALKAKEAQREAENIKQLDQLKSRFFANISHEFRTPLNLILAPLKSIYNAPSSSEIGMIRRNAYRLLRLVNQLLDLAKMEVGLMKLNFYHVEIYSFITDIAEAFYPIASSKSIDFQIDVPNRDYVVNTDPDKLEKIIYNLLSNAMKFTYEGGKVSIHCSLDANQTLRITVSDTGIGIPTHLKSKIFERFYQVDEEQRRVIEGTGIGLSLTKELVDLLNGTIELDSQENRGCTFIVKLPVETKENTVTDLFNTDLEKQTSGLGHYEYLESRKLNREVANENGGKDSLPVLLLVEDNDDLRNYLFSELQETYSLLVAENGKQGLKLAKEKMPDLVVTDIMMPEMDGITLTKYLREDTLTSHIPIVLLTAKDDVATKIEGFTFGAEQFLVKPFEIDELFARLNSLLTQRKLLIEKFGSEIKLEPSNLPIANKDAELLKNLIQIIEDNISDDQFSVEKLQKEIGMSRMQLHRKLKALTNQSTNDFIRTIKLKRAAQLLKQPGIQVSEAAFLSGFSHLSYFAKCFKEQFGVLPSAYAEQ